MNAQATPARMGPRATIFRISTHVPALVVGKGPIVIKVYLMIPPLPL